MFLSSNDSTPCFGEIVSLICYYPDVMEMGNEGFKSYATSANWLVNGKRIFPDGKVFDTGKINQTTSELIMKIDPFIFTGDPVSITCQPPLYSISEGEKSVLVDPQGSYAYTHYIQACTCYSELLNHVLYIKCYFEVYIKCFNNFRWKS